jgi:hypothetical protein
MTLVCDIWKLIAACCFVLFGNVLPHDIGLCDFIRAPINTFVSILKNVLLFFLNGAIQNKVCMKIIIREIGEHKLKSRNNDKHETH